MALVDGGSVRVGWPGEPGCTMTGGALESVCCAWAGSDNKQVRTTAAKIPTMNGNDCIGCELLSIAA